MVDLELVRACEEHARLVMEWRNDPTTLAASFNQEPKQWGSFWKEFQSNYFSTLHLPPLFAVSEGRRVAFLRFRPMPDPTHPLRRSCDISINIAPQERGKGFAVPCLVAATRWMGEQGVDDCFAEIKEDNVPSQKAFARAGFEKIRSGPVQKWVLHLTPPTAPRVFIIAEAGSNWRMGTPSRDREMARALIDVAVEAGADAVKFQTYHPDGIYVANAGGSDYLSEAGIKEDIRTLFEDLSMPYEMIPELAEYCEKVGIQFMATPFSVEDFKAVDSHVSVHKIASYELSHLRLLEAIAATGKPLIMSTGAAEAEDIRWAVETFRAAGGGPLTLLQCTAKYPAPLESMNLRVLPWLKSQFGVSVGLSDHSRDPTRAPAAAVALGASVIEKHYTLDNRLPGPDHSFALTPGELAEMVRAIRETERVLGDGEKRVLSDEEELYSYARRGIQALRDIPVGEELHEGVNIAILRPGKQTLGCHPKLLPSMLGAESQREIRAGEGLRIGDWNEFGSGRLPD